MPALQKVSLNEISKLLAWYQKNQRSFPWRDDPNPYWVWVAEVMSQQTQLSTVLPYFKKFINKFPTIMSLASAHEKDVLIMWAGLGYYSRARHLWQASKKIVKNNQAIFPNTFGGWLALPGIGPYSAAAITSQCFQIKEPVWDGNLIRICSRLDARKDAWTKTFQTEMKIALRKLLQTLDASQFNQSLMELGSLVCTPTNPICKCCPFQNICKTHLSGRQEQFPPSKPRKLTVKLRCKVWIRARKHLGKTQLLFGQRPKLFWFSDFWDMPSELGGASKPCLKLNEFEKKGGKFVGLVQHQITHHKITFEIWIQKVSTKTSAFRWFDLKEVLQDPPSIPLSRTAQKVLSVYLKANENSLASFVDHDNDSAQ